MTADKAITLTMMLLLAGSAWCAAHNVSGTVTCDGQGVAGVAVSDGHNIVLTDAEGRYAMTSDKERGYVFYTLPGGYEPLLDDGFNPKFWAPLRSEDVNVAEVHDFELRRMPNDRHVVIFGADTHIARRLSDRAYIKRGFIASLADEVERAGDVPVYSILLGDITWDVMWYQNDYNLTDFISDMAEYDYPVPLWSVIGNHDHDPSVPAGPNTDDLSSRLWRDAVCPNYYSFNLGKVHYVVLDDVVYLNEPVSGETYSEGIAGSRNYYGRITDAQMSWLEKDLALIDSHTPVVVCMHIPAWNITSSFRFTTRLDNTHALCAMLSRFDQAHIMSGHTHCNYTARPGNYPRVVEHNLATMSGTLWWSAALTGHHVCQDGSPAGYLRWTMDGDKAQWYFKPIHEGESQMRLYDMNTVSNFYRTNTAMRSILSDYPSRVNYANIESNTVMVNVFAYDTDWKVSICEGEDLLECERVYTEDPFHTLAYDVPSYNTSGYYSDYYSTTNSTHMFKARATTADKPITVRVIDSFGNIYLKSITRPHNYSLNMEKRETDLVVGDVNTDDEITIADINVVIDMLLGNGHNVCPPILADCNGDNEVNIADINTIIKLIYNQ